MRAIYVHGCLPMDDWKLTSTTTTSALILQRPGETYARSLCDFHFIMQPVM